MLWSALCLTLQEPVPAGRPRAWARAFKGMQRVPADANNRQNCRWGSAFAGFCQNLPIDLQHHVAARLQHCAPAIACRIRNIRELAQMPLSISLRVSQLAARSHSSLTTQSQNPGTFRATSARWTMEQKLLPVQMLLRLQTAFRRPPSLDRASLSCCSHLLSRSYATQFSVISQTLAATPSQLQPQSLLGLPEPTIFTGTLLSDWPLLSAWTPQYVAQRFGQRLVPVEKSLGGADYRDALHSPQQASEASLPERSFESNHLAPMQHLLGRPASDQPSSDKPYTLYLAQNDICESIPEFEEAFGSQPGAILGDRLIKRNIWLGPKGISTPLHHDPYHNLYVQAWGFKTVHLYHPRDSDKLYPFETRLLKNTSRVNAGQPDLSKHPLFANACQMHGLLRPGDILWIPKGWWHFIKAETASLSVSFWWL